MTTRIVVALLALGFAAGAGGQEAPPDAMPTPGEVIDVRTGFVRLMLPADAPAPEAEHLEVTWKGKPQPILRVVGGPGATLELGLAVDQSASLYRSFEPLRAAAQSVVTGALREGDRLFVAGFDETARLLDEGHGDEAARVLAALPRQPSGVMTGLFPVVAELLGRFQNVEARAALVVVTDGCDSDLYPDSREAARLSRERAIPVFLLMPNREPCQRIQCERKPGGEWRCYTVPIPGAMTPHEQLGLLPRSTTERARFLGLIEKQGGSALVARRPDDWDEALREILDRLSRQWLVVFEPSSDEVQSEGVEVFSTAGGKRRRLR